jgi:hypothetical protein
MFAFQAFQKDRLKNSQQSAQFLTKEMQEDRPSRLVGRKCEVVGGAKKDSN